MITIAMYQPDIPQNVGAMIRLCACLGLNLDIIEPCGFPVDDSKIKRVAMDYMDKINYTRHPSWDKFRAEKSEERLVLLTTRAQTLYTDYIFKPGDTLITGRESAGVPDNVLESVPNNVYIPMQPGLRSVNVVTAAAMIAGEALRQTEWRK